MGGFSLHRSASPTSPAHSTGPLHPYSVRNLSTRLLDQPLLPGLVFLCLIGLAGCGGGGGGNGDNPGGNGPSGGNGDSVTTVDVSGTVTPPEDVPADTLTIISLGETTTPNSSGAFTVPVREEGVTVIGAMLPGKEFGYLTIVARPGSTSSVASANDQSQQALQNEESIVITSQTTAESMVFLSSYLTNSDPGIAEQIMGVIRANPKVGDLASVIESVSGQSDPMSDPQLQEALAEAVQSVVDTLYQTQEKTTSSNTPLVKSSPDASKTVKLLQLPLISTQAATEMSLESPLDLDMTLLTITESGDNYVIEPQVALGHNVDWLIDFSELDPLEFPNGLSDVNGATNRDVFDRQGFRDSSYAVATSYFSYLDLFDAAVDYLMDYFIEDTTQPITIPGNIPAVYISRAYSGGMADLYEKDTVIPQVPDGSEFDVSAMVTNAALVATDIVSVIIPLPEEMLSCLIQTTINEVNDVIGQYLPDGLTVGEYVTIIGNGAEAGITAFIPCGGEAVFDNFLGFLGQTILMGVSSVLDITGQVSAIGEATQRAVEIVLYATPMESTIIIVGDPFLTASDTTLPSIPTGLTANVVSSTQIDLSWTASTDNVGVIGYKIFRGGTYLKSVTTISTSDTGLSPSTQYCYTVSAYDTSNNESAQSNQKCATTLAAGTAPSAPTGVNAVAGDGQVTISWNAVSGADSYNLYWGTGPGVTKTTGFKIASVTSPYVHTGRTNGVTYYYVVTAVNANGESAESSEVSATPTATTQDKSWGTATLIETNIGYAYYPQVAMDSIGNAMAVWVQRDDIWANRFE